VIRAIAPLRDFLHRESASGVLILIASFFGLAVANSPLGDNYQSFLNIDFRFGVDELYVDLTILKSINYVLMTVFFFVVGLEIKRELTSGHLSTFRKAIMPFVAAVGGMVVPAVIYLLIAGDVEPNGWGVPVATDIALAVGLLALVGTNAVASLRSFLLALDLCFQKNGSGKDLDLCFVGSFPLVLHVQKRGSPNASWGGHGIAGA
jgi:NhaA family Na+:H+ antiporter